ncbi:hypothetical protein [Peribacillus asahii]|uniref:hypothetical protein n=1 Tax=Peribacillus asahii TaxID=228899 RepID=UPI003815028A
MSNLAYYTTFYRLLSKMYAIAHYLESDPNYNQEDAVQDLMEVIHLMESDRNIFQKD